MKVLFVASVYRHLTAFHIPFMEYFQKEGYEVYAAGIGDEDKAILEAHNISCIDIPFSRSPFSSDNVKAYKQLKKLFKEMKFDLVHVHTPVAAFLTRAAFRKSDYGKILYTAHGFHFFKGAPLQNWLIYYPLERLAARWTDHLITINEEDYNNAKKFLPAHKVSLTHGVGVEPSKIELTEEEKRELKASLNLRKDSIVISYVAELNDNKNHIFLFNNWKEIKAVTPQYELLVIGTGEKEAELKRIVAERDLKDIHFLGFRRDVPKLLKITDIVCLLSLREGLPKSLIEAMLEGIPCIVSNIRGARDLINFNINGYVVDLNDAKGLKSSFLHVTSLVKNSEAIKANIMQSEKYTLKNILKEYFLIYKRIMNEK
ncbi:glycosyltransferase family 4 protein [Caryophanon latum]|uniref:Glycosyl transferase family 1 n=1 Tax=Caryophanon latum TaxID=33977 RepID=A0A1C0YIT7_9BACL|nr:glycosyltransferase family 4 protein [Caryophanon latum]OCS87063.1 glycosyl transferase family 1 [Caryophanon latum]